MIWIEVKWYNDVKWYEMMLSDMNWCEQCYKMLINLLKWCKMISNDDVRWC